jgi:hypothetical protein
VQAALTAMNECIAKREADRQAARARSGGAAAPVRPVGSQPRATLAAAVVFILAAVAFVATVIA